jgi:hypothetical protein
VGFLRRERSGGERKRERKKEREEKERQGKKRDAYSSSREDQTYVSTRLNVGSFMFIVTR